MCSRRPPPDYPAQLLIVLLGKDVELKNTVGNKILRYNTTFHTKSNNHVSAENKLFRIINTPNIFEERIENPDQMIIDLMALSHPGPDLFVLAIDSEHVQEEDIMAQVTKLQTKLGENLTKHLVVMLPDTESFSSLNHLRGLFHLALSNQDNLDHECRKLCHGRQSFLFDYTNYSRGVVLRRRESLQNRIVLCQPLRQPGNAGGAANGPSDKIFNIVLLGLTGTGKSATANTILNFADPDMDPVSYFRSEPSSLPVTAECDIRIMNKSFGVPVGIVDTPDFFHDQLRNPQAQIDECKRYCQPGRCVVLLVTQLGRFTDDEQLILTKLEEKLGWRIRDSTIVLLTHGEDLKGSLDNYISNCKPLEKIIELCGKRHCVFSNTVREKKQVVNLILDIPDSEILFRKFSKRYKMKDVPCPTL